MEGTFHPLICSHGDKGVRGSCQGQGEEEGQGVGRKQELVRFERYVSITGR